MSHIASFRWLLHAELGGYSRYLPQAFGKLVFVVEGLKGRELMLHVFT